MGKFKQHFVHMFCIVVIVVARLKLLISLVVVVVVVVVVVAMSNSVPHWHVEWIRRDVVCGPWGTFRQGICTLHITKWWIGACRTCTDFIGCGASDFINMLNEEAPLNVLLEYRGIEA